MNQQEFVGIQVLNSVLEKHLSIAQAAENMGKIIDPQNSNPRWYRKWGRTKGAGLSLAQLSNFPGPPLAGSRPLLALVHVMESQWTCWVKWGCALEIPGGGAIGDSDLLPEVQDLDGF